jgi:hypothetical protein
MISPASGRGAEFGAAGPERLPRAYLTRSED